MNRSTRLPRALAGALASTSVAAHAASAVFVTPGTPSLSSADIPAGFYGGGAPGQGGYISPDADRAVRGGSGLY